MGKPDGTKVRRERKRPLMVSGGAVVLVRIALALQMSCRAARRESGEVNRESGREKH